MLPWERRRRSHQKRKNESCPALARLARAFLAALLPAAPLRLQLPPPAPRRCSRGRTYLNIRTFASRPRLFCLLTRASCGPRCSVTSSSFQSPPRARGTSGKTASNPTTRRSSFYPRLPFPASSTVMFDKCAIRTAFASCRNGRGSTATTSSPAGCS